MPPEFCGWISRRIKPLSQEQVDKNSWN
ncbi:TPA: nuclease, partial [Citrobacter freundii]|nr:nuclease [Citrobacter freundii]HAU4512500.1 nuclease [Citrobacter freundii]HAU4578440.1 nuclease [Citrobacter freundii]HAU4621763.1 nuclease [Citrobacter freundii]HAU4788587.1 nuclease [Citrobacter freundii]